MITEINKLANAELDRANKLHPAFASAHEGYAVMLEECEELIEATKDISEHMHTLWAYTRMDEHINFKKVEVGNIKQAAINAAMEAIQVVAMCCKYNAMGEER